MVIQIHINKDCINFRNIRMKHFVKYTFYLQFNDNLEH